MYATWVLEQALVKTESGDIIAFIPLPMIGHPPQTNSGEPLSSGDIITIVKGEARAYYEVVMIEAHEMFPYIITVSFTRRALDEKGSSVINAQARVLTDDLALETIIEDIELMLGTPQFNFTFAPFSPDEVESINGFQTAGIWHELTCDCGSQHMLIATSAGLISGQCDYVQGWVHNFMANGSWQR